ncbi:GntR family transcriptional regulator [Trichococcus flocculiformis]|uniref:GntR family transcriptional regulator n=1 Tax=Trichococcus flocculiformis TaxID=82803 RepID=UPI003DA516FD
MFIEILPNSDTPIYTQLMYQIKIGILKREWSFGDGLPSVRSLASELGINMHTVNKAYNLLTDEGVLVKNQKGYFVSERAMIASNEATKAAMQDKLKEILIDKQIFEVTDETFREWLNEIEKALKGEGKTHADL